MQSESRHAVIMAGGKGTRLAPYTTVLPKPLMPIEDQPILEVVIRQLRHFGFRRVTISVGHLAELIMAFFGDGRRWGLAIDYAIEDTPQGTVGALRHMELPDEPFIVMNGDILTDLDYDELYRAHLANGSLLTIAGFRKHVDISLGVLDYDADQMLTGFREKPRLSFDVSMGIYVMDPAILPIFRAEGPYGFDHLVKDLMEAMKPPRIFSFGGLWLDIGRKEDYETAAETFRAHRARFLRPETDDSRAQESFGEKKEVFDHA
jgi:NDP-sugar pyrophosphorylase family protein